MTFVPRTQNMPFIPIVANALKRRPGNRQTQGPQGFSGSWWRYCCAFLIFMPSWPSHASIARRETFQEARILASKHSAPRMPVPRMGLHARCSRPAVLLASNLHSPMGTHVSPILCQFILKSSPALHAASLLTSPCYCRSR